ncbi:hypothetical protein MSG37_20855 [Shewanella sp. 1CM18E]|uniref:DUF6942 family protein n=1 Tax=Shewanella sp. 1CM18E TaxID=2929169 RepID=UPI0020C110E5|nr:hypothetical protein [Shewanella sp. 1CM18E]MCK8047337.1 hypothetical protein [Shewanella sp. 1CM18E]
MSETQIIIGNQNATRCFYLPTAPKLAQCWLPDNVDAIPALITANGNHWRKILTIMAKLSVKDNNWKHYRDTQLLKQDECIVIQATELTPNAQQHFICGQQSAQSLTFDTSDFTTLCGSEDYVSVNNKLSIYLCPYLDYRQFPNKHIDNLRLKMGLLPID